MTGNNPDSSSALAVATGLLLGLVARKRGAPGQVMLTTMLNTMAHVLSDDMFDYEGRAAAPTVDGQILGFGPLYRLYQAADGWVFLAAPQQDEWLRLARALPGDWSGDHRFSTPDSRLVHRAELGAALEAVFLTRPAAEWARALTETDVACAVVADGPPETTIMGPDGLGRALDLVVDLEHPVCGEYPRMRPLARLSRSRGVAAGAPLLGADTDRVLRELRYGEDQILDLHTKGVAGA